MAVNGVTVTQGDNNILDLANQDKQSRTTLTQQQHIMKTNVNQQMQQILSPKGGEKERASSIGKPVLESKSSIHKLELQQVEDTGPAEVLDLNGKRSSFEKMYTPMSKEGIKLIKVY